MGIAEAIPAKFAFPGAQSLILFHPPLPQPPVLSIPPVEIQIEILDDTSPSARKESENFFYNRNGHMDRKEKKGLFLDSYF